MNWRMILVLGMLLAAAGCDGDRPDDAAGNAKAAEEASDPAYGESRGYGEDRVSGTADGMNEPTSPFGSPDTEGPEKGKGPVCLDGSDHFTELTLAETDDGFELKSADAESPFVMQTLLLPNRDGENKVVQIVRRLSEGEVTLYRKDAVVFDFADRNVPACQGYPLFEAYVDDVYNVDSVAEAYGFLDADRLLYVAAVGDDPATKIHSYRVQTINILTGAIEVLFNDIPGAPTDDLFAKGWLTADRGTLVLNTYHTGMLWTFDLVKREVRKSERSFPHFWPVFNTVPSPDGELFWYTASSDRKYRLYTLDGELLAELPHAGDYEDYPPLRWSPDGRYAARSYMREHRGEHDADSIVTHDLVPQGIHFVDRRGKIQRTVETSPGSGEYLELAAWIDGGAEALIHVFKWESVEPSPDESTIRTIRYERLRLDTGERIALEVVDNPMEGQNVVYVPPLQNGPLYRIDTENHRIYREPLVGVAWPNVTDAKWAWYAIDEERGNSVLFRLDPERGVVAQRLEVPPRWPDAIVDQWFVSGSSYVRIIP